MRAIMINDSGNISQTVPIRRPAPAPTPLRFLGRLFRAIGIGYGLVILVVVGLWCVFGQNIVLLP